MKVPFLDLTQQYANIKEDIDQAIADVISGRAFVRGPFVSEFEEKFAEATHSKYCVSCANGTDAIFIVLKMLGIGPGDEVITVANSWIATSEVINLAGAEPIFVDISLANFNIDVARIEEKISKKTKAIIPVHLLGTPANMPAIMELCNRHGLFCIEDCAQAHLAEIEGKVVGNWGNAGTFSFYPGKNLGAYGDAGCIVTNDKDLAEKCRTFANHGSLVKHQHVMPGINSRLDGMQAAILLAKLPHLEKWNDIRLNVAKSYDAKLSNVSQVVRPEIREDLKQVFHIYMILCERRDELATYLKEKGIDTVLHYPTPLPFLEAYAYQGNQRADFPVVSDCSKKILSIPIFPEISEEQIDYVCATIIDFYE